ETPTIKDPINPGPLVNATADRASFLRPEEERASFTTGIRCCWCALDASSGTTPPYFSWTDCNAIILLSILPSEITEADVSSQEDSIASILIFTITRWKR